MITDDPPIDTRYETVAQAPPRRRSWIGALAVPLIAFLLGLAAMGWVLSRWDTGARLIGIAPEPTEAPAPAPAAAPVLARTVATPNGQAIVVDPELHQRVQQLEQRLGGFQQAARAAVGNADRAEGLLVAFAARRALDRGAQLGYIEALLRERFAGSQPQAVGMVITNARSPVTLQELQDELATLEPALIGAPPDRDWWGAIRAELGTLVTVRREGTPSTVPAERFSRAQRRLESGQVDLALAEVLRMPARANARDWVMKARRYVDARRALDTIETAALLEPRLSTPRPVSAVAAPAVQPRPAPPPAR